MSLPRLLESPCGVSLIDLKRYSILDKIHRFFDDQKMFDLMYEIVNHPTHHDASTGIPSLRKIYTTLRRQLPADKFDLYEAAIAANSKQLFDTFCRQNNPEGIITFSKFGRCFTTTVAQLNLFRIVLSHGVLDPLLLSHRFTKQDPDKPNLATSNNMHKQRAALVNAQTVVQV
jgi:hypothetical protein